MYDKTTLGLEEALRAVTAAIRAAEDVGSREPRTWPGIAVAVVDKEGELVAGARMDGMAPRFFRAARRKAYTAAVMERDTAGVMEFWNRQQAAGHHGPHDWNDPMLTTLPGGYVVKYGTKIVGAIGISGGSSGGYDDEYFADIAMTALGGEFRHAPAWDRKRVGDLPRRATSKGKNMDDVVRGLSELSTPTVSDALDRLGIAGQAEGIYPVDRAFRLAGRAFTVLYQPVDVAGGTVGDFVDDVPPGDVVVLDNSGRLDATVWGDIMTLVAQRRGLGGTVINGICRDSDRALKVGYPLFSRNHWMRTGKDRVQIAGQQVPVVLGGVRVRPGDVLIGDSDGVVAVPAERESEVLTVAAEIEKAEEAIRQEVERGTPLREARQRLGYHQLQTPATRAPRENGRR